MSQSDPPRIKNWKGRWDEYLAAFVFASPFILLLLGAGLSATLIATGVITWDVTVTGTLTATWLASKFLVPVAYAAGAVFLLGWLLAAAKIFGIAPVAWIGRVAQGYNPQGQRVENTLPESPDGGDSEGDN